jgi:hypothetical protein
LLASASSLRAKAILIHDKGDKVRAVYVYNGAAYAQLDWITVRGDGAGLP